MIRATITKMKIKTALPIIIIATVLAMFPLFGSNYSLHILILMFLNLTYASGCRLSYVTGLGSFCQITFVAIGAYISALMTTGLGVPWVLGFICGGIGAALIAFIFAWPTVKARGSYFFLLSFALFMTVDTIIAQWNSLTGGRHGIINIPPIFQNADINSYYYISMAFAALVILFMWRLAQSRFGRELIAVGDSSVLAESTGIDTIRHKAVAFAIGAFVTGLGGSIYAHYITFISPATFGLFATMYILIWVVLGGARKVWGPIAGAIMMTLVIEGTRTTGTTAAIIYAAILLAVVILMPQGIAGLVDTIREKGVIRKRVINGNS